MSRNKITKVSGQHYLVSFGSSVTSVSWNLLPAAISGSVAQYSDVLDALSDAFLFYRFTKLEIEYIPGLSGLLDNPATLGFYSQVGLAATPSNNQNMEAPVSMPVPPILSTGVTQSVPRKMVIPRKTLQPPMTKWLRTRISSADDDFEIQGVLYYTLSATASPTDRFVVHWACEFTEPAPTAVTAVKNRLASKRIPRLVVVQDSAAEEKWTDVVEEGDEKDYNPRSATEFAQLALEARKLQSAVARLESQRDK